MLTLASVPDLTLESYCDLALVLAGTIKAAPVPTSVGVIFLVLLIRLLYQKRLVIIC